ncbi:MAG: hypothetical protein ACXV5Q_14820 [Frankiaceae bacterium]
MKRGLILGHRNDDWLRRCAGWLAHLDADGYLPAVNLRPSAGWPDRAVVAVDLARVRAVINRIAADIDELARARRVEDLDTAAVLPDPRAERRRLAEPDLEFRGLLHPAPAAPDLPRPRLARDTRSTTRRSRRHVAARSAIFMHSACPACSVQQSGHAGGVHGVVLTGTPTTSRPPATGLRPLRID